MVETGLTSQEAQEKIKRYGLNELPEAPPPSNAYLFFSQLKSPLVYVLLVAAIVTFVLHEYTDFMVIIFAVLLNTVLGFFQEKRAGQALRALKKLIHPEAKVIRDSKLQQIEAKYIVPGDIVVLNKGDKIPADGKLVFANRLFVNESSLTGESVSVHKDADEIVYLGTIVTAGQGKFLVENTGVHTEIGKLALSLGEIQTDTPLRRQLSKFSSQLTYLVLGLTLVIFVTGIIFGKTPLEVFETSVALAVAAIPEGLLIGLTVVLAIGMQRILAKKGLVRNLVSAETLGGVTTICVDKTGTLTQGKMQVVDVHGNEEDLALQTILANDLDDPIVIAAYEWGIKNEKFKNQDYERFDSIPFNSDNKFFTSLHNYDDKQNVMFVNGAPEIVVEQTNLAQHDKDVIRKDLQKLSNEGKRVLGFARKFVSNNKKELSVEDVKDLEWVGMIGFNDPIRTDVKESLQKTHQAGIKLIVITGDYAQTAASVLKQIDIDINQEDIILGSELETFSDQQLEERVYANNNVKLFARTKPAQKLKIVSLLQSKGEVVAMMGDGVNDAPAITSADIGIVVGEATDVAKESADLVLLDSSFKTIVLAIEEGRGIFNNLRKILLYLMSDAFVGIFVVLAAIFTRFPLPISAAQVLWINLISDGFPNLALTVDPKEKDIMKYPPRSPKEPLLSSWLKWLILIVSSASSAFAFALFYHAYTRTGDIVFARSVVFATVGINSLIYVFSIKGLTQPFWKTNMFNNKWLLLAVFGGLLLQFSPYLVPVISKLLNIVPIGNYWYGVFGAAGLVFIIIELSKYLLRRKLTLPSQR